MFASGHAAKIRLIKGYLKANSYLNVFTHGSPFTKSRLVPN